MYLEYSPIRNRLFYHVIKPDLLEIFSQFTKVLVLRLLGEKWRLLTGGDYHNVNAYHLDKPDTFGCLGIIRYTELERIARLYDYFKYFLKQLDDWTWLESIGESRKAKRFTSGRLAHASAYKPNRRDYAIDKSYLENIRLDKPFDTTINYAVYLSENNTLLT